MNKMPTFQLKRLSEMRHFLPDDTAAAQDFDYRQSTSFEAYQKSFAENIEEILRMPGMDDTDKDAIRNALEQNPQDYNADEWVLTLGFDRLERGNWEVEDLDLDHAWETLVFDKPDDLPKGEPPFIYLIVVNGNLKTRNIYNRETDGATGLITLGNLQADNIVVGGQEIYVTGDLAVKGLFWGDYNHGELVVAGNIMVPVFISTDYGFDHKRFKAGERIHVTHWLWDEMEDEFIRDRLDTLLLPDCLMEEEELIDEPYSYKDWLFDDEIFYRLKNGKPLLLEVPRKSGNHGEDIPFVFESHEFNSENLKRLRESPLFLDHIPQGIENRQQRVEYWREGIFKRVLVIKDKPCSEVVYFQKEDKALVIHYEMHKPNLMERLKGHTDRHEIAIYCRTLIKDKETEWEGYNPALPAQEKFREMTQPLWEDLLNEWSEMEYWQDKFRHTISVEKIESILGLPLIRDKYSDYYNDDADDFWLGNRGYQFRQPDNEQGKCSRISAIRQFFNEEAEEEEFEFYHFDIETIANKQVGVVLYSQKGNNYDDDVHLVRIDNTEEYRKAIRCFEWLEKKVFKHNEVYMRQR